MMITKKYHRSKLLLMIDFNSDTYRLMYKRTGCTRELDKRVLTKNTPPFHKEHWKSLCFTVGSLKHISNLNTFAQITL